MVAKDLIAASSKPLVLSILSHGESYGYEIIQKVRILSNDRLQWTDGMLYPVLHRLERAGLISSSWGISESGRKRRYYRITPKGERELVTDMAEWAAVHATLENAGGMVPCLS